MELEDLKVCGKCKVEKPKSEFYKDKRWGDGLSWMCKECHNAYNKAWFQAHPEENHARCKRRYEREKLADGQFTEVDFTALKDQYDYTCLCCGKREPEVKLVADHVIPLALCGSNDISNRQPLCISCNSSKGIKTTDYRDGTQLIMLTLFDYAVSSLRNHIISGVNA